MKTKSSSIGAALFFCVVVATRFLFDTDTVGAMNIDPTKGFSGRLEQEFVRSVARGNVDVALKKAARLPLGVNTTGSGGETALFIAAKTGDIKMTRALLAAGANPNGGPACAPLAAAVQNDSLGVAQELLRAGASSDGRIDDETALIRAALSGRLPAVELLVTAGADLHLSNSVDVTAALFAAAADHWTVVLFLIEAGADPFWTQKSGVTLAHYVASAQNFETVEDRASYAIVKRLLLQAGLPAVPPPASEVRKLRMIGNWPPNLE